MPQNRPVEHREIVIIGAGPAGAVAAALLKRKGHDVLIVERQQFPRFSLGESLLPQCMEYLEEAGLLDAVHAANFQPKNGAAFACGDNKIDIDFRDKFSPGPGTTYQVESAVFDKVLADAAAAQGVEIRYRHAVSAATTDTSGASIDIDDLTNERAYTVQAQFVLDASGYGRVLARLFDLERPSTLALRHAIFTHIEDRIVPAEFDREKILISIHPQERRIWYWLIPFSNGRCSIGVVGEAGLFGDPNEPVMATLQKMTEAAPNLKRLLRHAVWDTPANTIGGYSASVTQLHGESYAMLGNAAEFLDPIFSSGVTIAMHSAKLAADALHRQLKGETVDWDTAFSQPLLRGVETFRTYVESWYAGPFQDVVFHRNAQPEIRAMISSVLAGYAWDQNNPFVADHQRRLPALARLCQPRPLVVTGA